MIYFLNIDDKEFNKKNYKTECRNKNDCYASAPDAEFMKHIVN